MNAALHSIGPAVIRAGSALPPAVLINPLSFRVSRGELPATVAQRVRAAGGSVIEASSPPALQAAVPALLAAGSVVVLAGDGTVQALIEQLALQPAGTPMPRLLILGGGRSNLIAADFNGRGALLRKLDQALRQPAGLRLVEREVLRIDQAGAPPHFGFFLAGALIDAVIRTCHRDRAGGGLRSGRLSTPLSLSRIAWRSLLGRSELPEPPALRIDAGDGGRLEGAMRVLAISTLEHPGAWLNPYAACGDGPLRITAVSADAPRFRRRLPRLLQGRFDAAMRPEQGYLSGRCRRVSIEGLARYTLDGEPFNTDPAVPLILSAGPRLRFLHP